MLKDQFKQFEIMIWAYFSISVMLLNVLKKGFQLGSWDDY